LLELDGREPWGNGGHTAPFDSRTRWRKTLPSIRVTATTKIAVPITLICGGVATRAEPQTKIGNVTRLPALKYVTTKSSIEIAKHRSSAARIAGAISGRVTFWKVSHSLAPRSIAAS